MIDKAIEEQASKPPELHEKQETGPAPQASTGAAEAEEVPVQAPAQPQPPEQAPSQAEQMILQPPPQDAKERAFEIVKNQLMPTCSFMLNGVVACMQQQIPPPILAMAFSAALGEVLSNSTKVGALAEVFRVRDDIEESFRKGLRKVSPVAPSMARPGGVPPHMRGRMNGQ
jgi:hypothetical protein